MTDPARRVLERAAFARGAQVMLVIETTVVHDGGEITKTYSLHTRTTHFGVVSSEVEISLAAPVVVEWLAETLGSLQPVIEANVSEDDVDFVGPRIVQVRGGETVPPEPVAVFEVSDEDIPF